MVPNRISSHLVVKGRKFTKCYYLKKVSEKEEFIKYKQLDRESICITVTILCPVVQFKEDFTLFLNEYEFTNDMLSLRNILMYIVFVPAVVNY